MFYVFGKFEKHFPALPRKWGTKIVFKTSKGAVGNIIFGTDFENVSFMRNAFEFGARVYVCSIESLLLNFVLYTNYIYRFKYKYVRTVWLYKER